MTYEEAIKKYWNKPDEFHYEKNQNEPYILAAKAIYRCPVNCTFEECIFYLGCSDFIVERNDESVNWFSQVLDNDKHYNNKYVKEGKEYRLTNKIQGKQYYVKSSYDDFVFAWLFCNIRNWDTSRVYDEIRIENEPDNNCTGDFYSWFINKCRPNSLEEYHPGQKWHYFEYILYSEINGRYMFSRANKVGDICKERHPNRFQHSGLVDWRNINA